MLQRTSAKMQAQIRELRKQGYSKLKIAESLGICRKTVRKVLAIEAGGPKPVGFARKSEFDSLNWKRLFEEESKGVPIKTLWQEQEFDNISYRKFWGEFRKRKPVAKPVTIKLHHSPGEKAQIDFCDGIDLVCRSTGEVTRTHLFVAVLPFSAMPFGEFSLNQKLDTFLDLQDKAFGSFGGVPSYVVPDNLKSGVLKAHRYDPDANPTYCEYGNHMGFAVLPARPYSPKDKASVESHIGLIQRSFFSQVRNQTFHSLFELNQVFKKYLAELVRGEMKDYGVSRLDRFEFEKKHLKPLPKEKFERREWKLSKVHPDCHIQVQRHFYSVPHQYVGRQVRVRLSARLVEIFDVDLKSIATHGRLHGKRGQYATNDKHYPDEQVGVARYEVKHGKRQAQKIGPKTKDLVDELLSGAHPLRFLRRVQGILRLYVSGRVGRDSMEYAAKQALSFERKNFSYFQSCALHFEANGAKPVSQTPKRDINTIYLKHNNKGGPK